MAEKIMMFALSPTMESGTILKWNKVVGDTIASNEAICEVETDKSSMDYESMNTGILLQIIVPEGESAVVGKTIAIVGSKGEDIAALLKEVEAEGGAEALGTSESTPSQEKEEIPSQTNAQVSTPVASAATPATTSTISTAIPTGKRVIASPLARKLADSKGVNIASIVGSGPGGRIVKRDVEQAPSGGGAVSATGMRASRAVHADVLTPIKGVRAVIAQRLSESKFSAPHFYVKNTVRTEAMIALRSQCNALLPEKLSLNAFIIKLVAEAIAQHPEINASWQGENIVQYASIDIGLAVDLGSGLFTPIVRDCAHKGIQEIDAELKVLIEKVRNNTISAGEYSGATFTLSNLGSFGVDEFTAIINPPGSGILAIGRSKKVPVVSAQGSIEVGSVMTITLSSDHRVIDGSLAGRFISKLQGIIENPGMALL